VSLKVIIGWVVVAFLIWLVIAQPDDAVHTVYDIGQFLTIAAHGISDYFSKI